MSPKTIKFQSYTTYNVLHSLIRTKFTTHKNSAIEIIRNNTMIAGNSSSITIPAIFLLQMGFSYLIGAYIRKLIVFSINYK